MMSDAIGTVRRHLDRAHDAGRNVAVWWRDDDAIAATPALGRLLDLSAEHEAPLALACIPARIEPDLPERIAATQRIAILPHGYDHSNHAEQGRKNSEFGADRPQDAVRHDLERARSLTHRLFGSRALDLFVPPWNRIATCHLPLVAKTGYRGISTFGRKGEAGMVDLVSCPTHLDPVAWRGSRSLVEPGAIDAMLADALGAGGDRIGLLTHHLVFDEPLWRFLSAVLDLFGRHPATRFVSAADLIGAPAP